MAHHKSVPVSVAFIIFGRPPAQVTAVKSLRCPIKAVIKPAVAIRASDSDAAGHTDLQGYIKPLLVAAAFLLPFLLPFLLLFVHQHRQTVYSRRTHKHSDKPERFTGLQSILR